MAFTAWELWRGALIALGMFLAIAPLGYAVIMPEGFLVIWFIAGLDMAMFAVPATLVLGVPLAWLLGLATARLASQTAHLIGFAALGLALGGATTWIALTANNFTAIEPFGWVIPILCTGFASAFGWWRTMSWGLGRDGWMARRAIQSLESRDAMSPVAGSERSDA